MRRAARIPVGILVRIFVVLLGPAALSLSGCSTALRQAGSAPPALPAPGWSEVQQVAFVPQRGVSDCGTAALAMVIARWEPSTGAEAVRRLAGPVDDAGVQAGRLRALARGRGLHAFLIEASFADLAHEVALGRPVLVGVVRVVGGRVYRHYEVVSGINPDQQRLLTADPAEGWREQSFDEFATRWRPARNLALVVWK